MSAFVVFIIGTIAVPGFAPVIPGSATGSIPDLAPASLILPTTPIPSTIPTNETPGMSDPEYQSRMYELEKEKHSLERERYNVERKSLLLSWFAAVSGFCALVFLGWRVVIMAKQAKEQELASYRERLFSEDPSARIAAAMSLSKYPKEAIWLVSRWAREHKLFERANSEAESGNEIKKVEASDHEQVKKAIEDALGIMAEKRSCDWKRFKWNMFRIPSRFVFWRKGHQERFCLPIWPYPYVVRGPRLDRIQMTLDIGPIPLGFAYLYRANLCGVNLRGANLAWANLQGSSLWEANLQGIYLYEANLQGATLWEANLQGANLERTNLQNAKLKWARMQIANLQRANLQGADLEGVKLQGTTLWDTNLQKTNLYGASLEGASLWDADLQGANVKNTNFEKSSIRGVNLRDIQNWREIFSLKGANIFGIIDPPYGFRDWALSEEVGAVEMDAEEEMIALTTSL